VCARALNQTIAYLQNFNADFKKVFNFFLTACHTFASPEQADALWCMPLRQSWVGCLKYFIENQFVV
jgi:hypothetical protein